MGRNSKITYGNLSAQDYWALQIAEVLCNYIKFAVKKETSPYYEFINHRSNIKDSKIIRKALYIEKNPECIVSKNIQLKDGWISISTLKNVVFHELGKDINISQPQRDQYFKYCIAELEKNQVIEQTRFEYKYLYDKSTKIINSTKIIRLNRDYKCLKVLYKTYYEYSLLNNKSHSLFYKNFIFSDYYTYHPQRFLLGYEIVSAIKKALNDKNWDVYFNSETKAKCNKSEYIFHNQFKPGKVSRITLDNIKLIVEYDPSLKHFLNLSEGGNLTLKQCEELNKSTWKVLKDSAIRKTDPSEEILEYLPHIVYKFLTEDETTFIRSMNHIFKSIDMQNSAQEKIYWLMKIYTNHLYFELITPHSQLQNKDFEEFKERYRALNFARRRFQHDEMWSEILAEQNHFLLINMTQAQREKAMKEWKPESDNGIQSIQKDLKTQEEE